MKKFILIMILGLLFLSNANAEERKNELDELYRFLLTYNNEDLILSDYLL